MTFMVMGGLRFYWTCFLFGIYIFASKVSDLLFALGDEGAKGGKEGRDGLNPHNPHIC